MDAWFIDSSAAVKRYVPETGSTWVESLFDPIRLHEVFVAVVTGVEIASAIVRRSRAGSLSAADAKYALGELHRDLAVDYHPVDLTPAILFQAFQLVETYALRGYDAVQLASAVNSARLSRGLSAITFVSADLDLNSAAVAEGLKVDDPNTHL